MAVPKKKTTKSARNQRRSHHALKKLTLSVCSSCGAPVRPHTICKACGSYRGRKIGDIQEKIAPKKSKAEPKKEKKEDKKSEKSKDAKAPSKK